MLVRLDLSTDDRWTTLIGSFAILHGPVTAAIMNEARASTSAEKMEDRWADITKFVARAIIRDWRGIGGWDDDMPPPVSAETVDAVLDIYPIFIAFNEKVMDARIRVDREKKDLPTLQPITSGSAQDTAGTATGSAPTAPES